MENGSKFYMVKKKALPEILLKVAEANVTSLQSSKVSWRIAAAITSLSCVILETITPTSNG